MSQLYMVILIFAIVLLICITARGISEDWAEVHKAKWAAMKAKYEYEQGPEADDDPDDRQTTALVKGN